MVRFEPVELAIGSAIVLSEGSELRLRKWPDCSPAEGYRKRRHFTARALPLTKVAI